MLSNYHSCSWTFHHNLVCQSGYPIFVYNVYNKKYEGSEHKFKSIWLHMFKQTSWFQRCQVYCNLDEAWCGILDVLRWQRARASLTPPLSSAIFNTRILKNQTQKLVPEIEQLKRNITIWRHDGEKFRPSRKRPFLTDTNFYGSTYGSKDEILLIWYLPFSLVVAPYLPILSFPVGQW